MDARVRRLIRFPCAGAMLSGSVDEAAGSVGLLCVTGGSQVRCGPHRMLHSLARRVADAGYPVFRYERRGLGDSEGFDPGYRDSGPDLAAAAAAFRNAAPELRTLVGFGLCDGATTLALHGERADVSGIVLANPWLVETAPDDLAPAAAKAHYRDRLLSPKAWAGVLTGRVDLLGAAKSIFGAATGSNASSLGDEVAARLAPYAGKLLIILADRDGTAIAAQACWNGAAFMHVRDEEVVTVPTDSHTFAREGDHEHMTRAVIAFMHKMSIHG